MYNNQEIMKNLVFFLLGHYKDDKILGFKLLKLGFSRAEDKSMFRSVFKRIGKEDNNFYKNELQNWILEENNRSLLLHFNEILNYISLKKQDVNELNLILKNKLKDLLIYK